MKKALVVVLLVALVGGTVAATAQGGYSVSVSGSTTDIPSITVSFGGSSHTISEVGVRDPGGSVTVDAEGPQDTTYDVNLYNADGDIVQNSRKSGGSTTTEFDLGCCSPGTYGVAIYDGEVKDLAGVVVAGYEVTLDMPDSAERNSTVTATVELTETGGGSIEEVQVVLSGNGEDIRTTAQQQSGSTYEATIALDDVPTGSYDAHGIVLSPDEFANGQHEVIGLGAGQSFTVTESSDGSDGDDGSDETATPTSTPTANGSDDPTATDDPPRDDDDGSDDGTPTDPDAEDNNTATDDDQDPTEPDDGTDSPGDRTDPGTDGTVTDDDDDQGTDETNETASDGAGFGAVLAVAVLAAVLLIARRP